MDLDSTLARGLRNYMALEVIRDSGCSLDITRQGEFFSSDQYKVLQSIPLARRQDRIGNMWFHSRMGHGTLKGDCNTWHGHMCKCTHMYTLL